MKFKEGTILGVVAANGADLNQPMTVVDYEVDTPVYGTRKPWRDYYINSFPKPVEDGC